MIKVTVLMGGVSSEREVSISSGKAVSKALKIAGYDIEEIVITNESFNAKIIDSDITFIALHAAPIIARVCIIHNSGYVIDNLHPR